jgi:PAS domain S-box-containing protein
MKEELKIVLIEDSVHDVSLIQRVLTKEKLKVSMNVVHSKDDFLRALKEFNPDVVLSDHSLPQFNSSEAYRVFCQFCKAHNMMIPFILVTGTVSEDFAVQCMKDGMDDYIIKDRISRLPAAILGAIQKKKAQAEKHQAEIRLLESQQQLCAALRSLKHIMDFSLDVICTIDQQGKFIEVSEASRSVMGYSPDEMTGQDFLKFIAPEHVVATRLFAEYVMKGRTVMNFENQCLHKNGNRVPLMWSARWVKEDGLMYCVARDATEKKAAEKRLLDERNMLRAIIDNIPHYIIVKDKNLNHIVCNKAAYTTLFGASSEAEVLGKNMFDYFDPELATIFCKEDWTVLETGSAHAQEEEITLQGESQYMETIKVPLIDHTGNVIGLVGISSNVTEQKKYIDMIEMQNERLKEIAWTQSHIVRAPLARIIGLVNILSYKSASIKDIRQMILDSAMELDGIIRDIVIKSEAIKPSNNRNNDS